MIAYSIIAAKESGLFDHIIVSTDSDEIAGVARDWGADVPFRRPAELANDFAGTDEVFLHGIVTAERLYGPTSFACCIYPAAPLLRIEYLRRGLELLREKKAASAFAATTFDAPIFRALRMTEQDRLVWQWPEFARTRSQDLPCVVHDAGQFYWVDAQSFKNIPDTLHDAVPVVLPRWAVQDIDTMEDWESAERLFESLKFQLQQTRPLL
jgi:pseudaminic acid cytidylyltransferase